MPTSTIRLYQGRGLLDAPERNGRVGVYSDRHLERLRTIARLQETGFSLAGIHRLISAHQQGHGLTAVLGLPSNREPLRLSIAEVTHRFSGQQISQQTLQRAMSLGLLSLDGDTVVIPEPEFLRMGSQLASLGVDVESVLDEYDELRQQAETIAARFVGLFESSLWEERKDSRGLTGDLPDLAQALRQLGPLAEQVVSSVLRRALESSARQFVDDHRQELIDAGMSDAFDTLFPPAPKP